MIRPFALSLAALLLAAGLVLAEPRVEVRYFSGIPQLVLSGDYPQSHYTIWRAPEREGPFTTITAIDVLCVGTCYAEDYSAEPGRTYWYRFDLVLADGTPVTYGPYSVAIAAAYPRPINASVFPNPARGPARVELYLSGAPSDAPLTAEVTLHDIQGRRVRTILSGPLRRGVTMISWDGRDDSGRELGTGYYFLRFVSPLGSTVRRVVRAR